MHLDHQIAPRGGQKQSRQRLRAIAGAASLTLALCTWPACADPVAAGSQSGTADRTNVLGGDGAAAQPAPVKSGNDALPGQGAEVSASMKNDTNSAPDKKVREPDVHGSDQQIVMPRFDKTKIES